MESGLRLVKNDNGILFPALLNNTANRENLFFRNKYRVALPAAAFVDYIVYYFLHAFPKSIGERLSIQYHFTEQTAGRPFFNQISKRLHREQYSR